MNAKAFSELLTDISDEYIVSAGNPRSKPIRWYTVSAIAACLVIGMAAIIYPKLQVQSPEIREPMVTSEITLTTITTESKTLPMVITGKSEPVPVTTAPSTVSTAETEVVSSSFSTSNAEIMPATAHTQTTSAVKTAAVTESTGTITPMSTFTSDAVSVQMTGTVSDTTDFKQETTTDAEQADTTDDNSYSTNVSALRKETEKPLDFWILEQTVMEEEPIHRIREWKLYREGLPDDFAYDTVPDIDFSEYDCLIVHFSAYTYIDDPPHGYYPISMNYQIKIFPVYDKPVGTVVEYVMAFPIPKALYADTAPEGVRDIQMGMGISGNSEMICKLVYWENT